MGQPEDPDPGVEVDEVFDLPGEPLPDRADQG
jgi:hypothetical protein